MSWKSSFQPSDKCETLYAVDERGVVASTSAKADMDEFVQSSNALNNNETTVDTEIPRLTAEEVEEQTQLRKQIVSLGKQPRAQQGRKKKDMVLLLSGLNHVQGNEN